MNLEEMIRTQRPYIDSFTCPEEYDAGEAEILSEVARLTAELKVLADDSRDSLDRWQEARREVLDLRAELAEARKEVVAERTVRETCARVADQLQIVLDAHRRFHGKVGCPGLIDGCYVCQAEQSIGPTPTEPATDG